MFQTPVISPCNQISKSVLALSHLVTLCSGATSLTTKISLQGYKHPLLTNLRIFWGLIPWLICGIDIEGPFSCLKYVPGAQPLHLLSLCSLSDLTSSSGFKSHWTSSPWHPFTHLHTWNCTFLYSHLRKDITLALPCCWESSKDSLLLALSSDWH